MHSFEILDRGGAPQVEQVLARADVASPASLAGSDMSQSMLDSDAGAEGGAPGRGVLKLAELPLELLVSGDRHAPALAGGSLRAARTKRAGAAYLGVEVDGLAGLERLHLARGTGDGFRSQVDEEVALGEETRLGCALCPWLREHGAAAGDHGGDDRAVHVGAVDVQFVECEALPVNVLGRPRPSERPPPL